MPKPSPSNAPPSTKPSPIGMRARACWPRSISISCAATAASGGSLPHRAYRVKADAAAEVLVGHLCRVGDMRAGRAHAQDFLRDRLEVGAEMHGRLQHQDRYLGRLDPDMTEHLLVVRLDALRGKHGGDAAVLVGDERHRADVEFGAAIHRAGAGEMTAAEPDDAPFRFDRRLTGKAHLGADAAREQRAFAGLFGCG